MLKLRPFKPCDAEQIVGWLKDEKIFHFWSAGKITPFPLTAKAFVRARKAREGNAREWAFCAVDENNEPLGFLTMRYPNDSHDEIRFGFIVVSNKMRGKGIGFRMLSSAAKYAFDFLDAQCITLAVFEQNMPAIRCYESVGFRFDETEKPESYTCMGETWSALRMVKKRDI